MARKLIYITLAAALLSAILAAICQIVFPDIGAFTRDETDATSWLREIAFMVKATAWISAEVAGLFAIVLATYLWRKRTPRAG
jgi:2C-methyl-D-erythritol 2,4-cyclodiphosphate synthase